MWRHHDFFMKPLSGGNPYGDARRNLEELGKGAAEFPSMVMLNAAPARALPAELLAQVDVLIVNQPECEAIARGRDPDMLGVPTVVVTRGAEGASLHRAGRVRQIAAFPVEAVDSVGAGDAFTGALATRWAEHQTAGMLDDAGVFDAVCWACAAGAITTTRAGAMPALARRAEVVRLLRTIDGGAA